MKKFTYYKKLAVTAVVAIALVSSLRAQTTIFYGLTYGGGSNNTGTIIKFNSATNTDTVEWSFGLGTDGGYPTGDLTFDWYNGLFYGLTVSGGTNSSGVIFSYNPATNAENVVWNFGTGSDGAKPYGNLLFDGSNGVFYGMTTLGGTYNAGTIISFNPTNGQETVAWNFGNVLDGYNPEGSLMFDPDTGLFYGLTYNGGYYGNGTIFSFNPSSDTETVLWSFTNSPDGESPFGNLVLDTTNKLLYGTTVGGGINHQGTIFSYSPSENEESVVWSLGGTGDGVEPYGSLVYYSGNGLFYGMTYAGGNNDSGTIIKFNPNTNKETVVWSLGKSGDGTTPYGNLAFEPTSGLFYGMTRGGGSNGLGTIIEFNPSNNDEIVVWNFGSGTDGQAPSGDLVFYNPNENAAVNNVGLNPIISISPNPSTGVYTLYGLERGQLIEVYNSLGQMINNLTVENFKQQMDISLQAIGIYLVRIFNSDGTPVGQQKVMKAN